MQQDPLKHSYLKFGLTPLLEQGAVSEQAPLLDENKEERHSFEVYQVCHGQNVAIMVLCFVQNCIGAHIA